MALPALAFDNYYSTTLSANISATDTVISLNAVPTASVGFLVIEPDSTTNREIIYYTSKGASTVTCPSAAAGRGLGGTTGVSHTSGSTVKMMLVAEQLEALQDATALTGVHNYFNNGFYDYVESGCVWTADAAGSTLNASMTSGVVVINGRRLTVAAVTARAFTASKDTYIDVLASTTSETGTVVYTEATNNAASAALAADSIRIGIIVTGAGNIAAAASINQGEPTRVLPIASSIPYQVTDSLGNLICNRSPQPSVIGYRQAISTTVTELSVPFIVPTGRKIQPYTFISPVSTVANDYVAGRIVDNDTTTTVQQYQMKLLDANVEMGMAILGPVQSPSAGLHTYKTTLTRTSGSGTVTVSHGATTPGLIEIRLVG